MTNFDIHTNELFGTHPQTSSSKPKHPSSGLTAELLKVAQRGFSSADFLDVCADQQRLLAAVPGANLRVRLGGVRSEKKSARRSTSSGEKVRELLHSFSPHLSFCVSA